MTNMTYNVFGGTLNLAVKTAEPIEMPLADADSWGPTELLIRWGRIPRGMDNNFGGKGAT